MGTRHARVYDQYLLKHPPTHSKKKLEFACFTPKCYVVNPAPGAGRAGPVIAVLGGGRNQRMERKNERGRHRFNYLESQGKTRRRKTGLAGRQGWKDQRTKRIIDNKIVFYAVDNQPRLVISYILYWKQSIKNLLSLFVCKLSIHH